MSRQRHDIILNNLLHVPNHALKGLHMLNHRTIYDKNTILTQPRKLSKGYTLHKLCKKKKLKLVKKIRAN